jgi:hypothetical protein
MPLLYTYLLEEKKLVRYIGDLLYKMQRKKSLAREYKL